LSAVIAAAAVVSGHGTGRGWWRAVNFSCGKVFYWKILLL